MSGRRVVDVDRAGVRAEVAVHAAAAIDRLDDESVLDEPLVLEGHPAQVLLDAAGEDVTLVVGRRGIGELKHRLLGSVSQYVATHSSGPVVVVPNDWESAPIRRIVVGFDGSEHAAAALRWALSIAPQGAEVEVVVALDVIPWMNPDMLADRHPDTVEDARRRISAAADEVDPAGRATRHFVVQGPRHALSDALDSADLVVVGPRGIGGLARTVIGSVTTWLLHEASCPVAVVPTGH
jgi:nucleotide-binding universal stress UspA family protein